MAEGWNSSSVFLVLVLLTVNMVSLHFVHGVAPAIYIFGDSTTDVGTNNHFNNTNPTAKANFPPNGIDFPFARPTGRFSNGFNLADTMSRLMGYLESPIPFLDLVDKGRLRPTLQIIKGVNFASAGSGILIKTGKPMGTVVSLGEQIQQFMTVRLEIEKLLGREKASVSLSKSVFFISVGSNDIFQYFLHNRTSNRQEFITMLIHTYENKLRFLHSLGARKFGIASTPPIGCCPHYRAKSDNGECLDDLNVYSRLFYSALDAMLQKLTVEFKEMKYSLGNTYDMVIYMMHTPPPLGFKEIRKACCGNGRFNGEEGCSPSAKVCLYRTDYMFWDWYHPTQTAAELTAFVLYVGPSLFVKPINFQQLQDDN